MIRRQNIINLILVTMAVIGIFLYLFLGSVSARVTKDRISIKGTLSEDIQISFTDVESAVMYDSFDRGLPSMIFKNFKITTGKYSSSTYGSYQLMIYNDVDKFIIVKSKDEYTIFNCPTEEDTKSCYSKIQEAMTGEAPSPEAGTEAAPEVAPGATEEPLLDMAN